MNARISCLIAILALAMLTVQARATVLTFTSPSGVFAQNNSLVNYPQTLDPTLPVYGDHVTSATYGTVLYPSAYSYGNNGEGFTPNVGIAYSPGSPALPRSPSNPFPEWLSATAHQGDFNESLYQLDIGGSTADLTLGVTFTADPGFVVNLQSFDLAGFWGGANNLDSLVIIVDGTPHVIGTNLAIANTSTTHTHIIAPYIGNTVEIFLDGRDTTPYGGSASQAYTNFTDIAIDNIVFGQIAPEPASLGLLACGSLLLLRRRKA